MPGHLQHTDVIIKFHCLL